MLFIIFANRANIQYNKEMKADIKPCWFVYFPETEELNEVKDFTINGAVRSFVDFSAPLPLKPEYMEITGPVHCWLHVEGDGVFFN